MVEIGERAPAFTTAIGFLLRAYERGIVNQELALEKLKELQRYGRYSAEIIAYAKEKIGESHEGNHSEAG